MKGYSSHTRAIGQISQELGIEQSQVQFVCDRLLTLSTIRYDKSVLLPGLGVIRSNKSKLVRRRELISFKLMEHHLNQTRHAQRMRMKKKPKETPAEPFYFDLEYV